MPSQPREKLRGEVIKVEGKDLAMKRRTRGARQSGRLFRFEGPGGDPRDEIVYSERGSGNVESPRM